MQFEHKTSNCEEDKDEMLDWAADFDLVLKNMFEDIIDEQECSILIANGELEIRGSSLIETQTQRI